MSSRTKRGPSASSQPRERIVDAAAALAPFSIVLVEPQIPPNTGNVARLCAATGCALHLVEPLGFSIDDRELKRAGLDYWHALNVVMHPSLDAFLANVGIARCWFLSTRGTHAYHEARYELGDYLVFGKETAGLPDSVLAQNSDHALRLPMRADSVRSLNLSTAVGIVAYAALARVGFPEMT